MIKPKKETTHLKILLRNFKLPLVRHKGKVLIIILVFGLLLLWRYLYGLSAAEVQQEMKSPPKTILWWTSMPNDYHTTRYCGLHKCTFNTQRQDLAKAEAIIFYASDMKIEDMPLPRASHMIWSLLHDESPRNVPFIPHTAVLQYFNFTSTFSRYSDLPLTTHHLVDANELTGSTYMLPIGEKTRLRSVQKLAPIAFMQSDCDTMSGRDDYVRELMKYIQIDSYGQCLHNRRLPKSLTENYLNKLNSAELYKFLARYKFIIAYENGVCDDYITEKFWRPLIVGSIPIYFGSPTAKDWQPNKKSVIYINDFSSPKALAEFIKKIDANDSEYNTYLDHKYEQWKPITNERLQDALLKRDHDTASGYIFGAFECFICRQIHETQPEQRQMATANHYNCPLPLVYPPMDRTNITHTNDDEWKSIMAVGRCQARILDNLWRQNKNYTKQQFDALLNREVTLNKCN